MISFVVPVYKVEKYIYTCIDSIFNLELNNFEIIIVNDGTPDKSIDEIQSFLKYPNVTLVNQNNTGLSVARNTGLNIAKGKYVWFIDSDDHLVYNENFKNELENLLQKDYDLIQIQYNLVYEGSELTKVVSKHFDKVISGIDLIKDRRLHIPAQFKIYNRYFLMSNKLFFYPQLLHEDVEFAFRVLPLAKKCISIEHPIYNYLQRNSGSITSTLSLKNVNSLVLINKILIKYIASNAVLLNEVVTYYENQICINTNVALRIICKKGILENRNVLNDLLTIDVLKCFKNSERNKYKIEFYLLLFMKKILK